MRLWTTKDASVADFQSFLELTPRPASSNCKWAGRELHRVAKSMVGKAPEPDSKTLFFYLLNGGTFLLLYGTMFWLLVISQLAGQELVWLSSRRLVGQSVLLHFHGELEHKRLRPWMESWLDATVMGGVFDTVFVAQDLMKFFDTVDWDLMVKALAWLKARQIASFAIAVPSRGRTFACGVSGEDQTAFLSEVEAILCLLRAALVSLQNDNLQVTKLINVSDCESAMQVFESGRGQATLLAGSAPRLLECVRARIIVEFLWVPSQRKAFSWMEAACCSIWAGAASVEFFGRWCCTPVQWEQSMGISALLSMISRFEDHHQPLQCSRQPWSRRLGPITARCNFQKLSNQSLAQLRTVKALYMLHGEGNVHGFARRPQLPYQEETMQTQLTSLCAIH